MIAKNLTTGLFCLVLCATGIQASPRIIEDEINRNVWLPCIMAVIERDGDDITEEEALILIVERRNPGPRHEQLKGLVS